MERIIICVGRQLGSGGRIIAKSLADAFGCRLYDKELLNLFSCLWVDIVVRTPLGESGTHLTFGIRLYLPGNPLSRVVPDDHTGGDAADHHGCRPCEKKNHADAVLYLEIMEPVLRIESRRRLPGRGSGFVLGCPHGDKCFAFFYSHVDLPFSKFVGK